jgi:CDGSH-type Zn-finger protein
MSEDGAAGQGKLAQVIATRGGLAAPEAPFIIEHREALIYMLCEAAELEHGIMCQYLFAAFSLKQSAAEGLTEAEAEVVRRWRKQITHVATQEMLHLTLVHNLMTAIGGAPHLGRTNLPSQANHYPAGVQLALLPFGEEALRHFMYLERPEGMDLADAPGIAAIGRVSPLMAEGDIVPRLQDFATVGHLYRSIEAGLAGLTQKYGEQWLFIGPPRAQATSASFHWPELIPVTDLASACRAVGEILEQGEGPRGHWQTAHFGQFVTILDEYEQLRAANPSFDPVRPVIAANVRPLNHGDVPLVTDPLTAQCMDLFNTGYEALLLTLERYFAHTEESDEQLQTLAEVTLGLMFRVIRPLGDLIPMLPAGAEYPGKTAGPSFELFYESDYLIPHRAAAWALLEERLREAQAFAERCRTGPAAQVQLVNDVLVPVGASLAQLADSLAAHFPDWGLTSRWAPTPEAGAAQSGAAQPADRDNVLAQVADLMTSAGTGPYAALAAAVHTAITSAASNPTTVPMARLVNSVLRPLATAAGTTTAPAAASTAGGAPTASSPDAPPATPDAPAKPLADQLRDLALTAARLRVVHGDPVLMEASAALQEMACQFAVDGDTLLEELRAIHADLQPGITVATDGPYLVTNAELLRNWLGEDLAARPQLALCRCGESAIKPYCDGSHVPAGFTDAKDPKRVPDQRDTYPGQQVTIFDNRGICQHSGLCTDRLSTVFHAGSEPFVTPGGGRSDEVIAAVRSCPSGALSYAVDDVEERAAVDYHGTREQVIEVSKDGPYRITGGLPLVDSDANDMERAQGSSREHYALCRCGHSQNKPFCSGMHWYVGFADPAPSLRQGLFEWAGGLPALTAVARMFYEKHVPGDPVLAPLYANQPPGQAQRAAARMAEAFGGPRRPGNPAAKTAGAPASGTAVPASSTAVPASGTAVPASSTAVPASSTAVPASGTAVLASGTTAPGDVPALDDDARARWIGMWLRCADEAKLPADPEFRSAFAAYIAWEAAAPAGSEAPLWDWGAAGRPPGASATSAAAQPATAQPADEPVLPGPDEPVSFAQHIKPLFRDKDRQSMSFVFDLWSYVDVSANAAAILDRVRNGTMPCDGTWSAEKVAVFQRWSESGRAE